METRTLVGTAAHKSQVVVVGKWQVVVIVGRQHVIVVVGQWQVIIEVGWWQVVVGVLVVGLGDVCFG